MQAEIVVVGGGIGGLTVAAILAARGLDVCLLEREPAVGGCASGFEKFGYQFETGYGLYAGWDSGEIHERIFAELPVSAPKVQRHDPSYLLRLPDGNDISIAAADDLFFNELKRVFPECAEPAIAFYGAVGAVGLAYQRRLQSLGDASATVRPPKRLSFLHKDSDQALIWKASQQSTADQLASTSPRFQRFIDAQLQALCQAPSIETSYLYAAIMLLATRGNMFGIQGGAAALASTLADSIKQSGGKLRLNTSVLRLAYNTAGDAVGVDLLSGETVTASRAIISNLTSWDTYGKLVGLSRLPTPIRQELKQKKGWGAYLLYLGLDDNNSTAKSDRLLSLSDWQDGVNYDAQNSQLFFNAAPAWDPRAPEGKRAVTVHTFTDVDDWFTFHTDETELEARDQQRLEQVWNRLHAAMPEFGSSIEVIDTATPRSFYEQTRRKLGMVGGLPVRSGDWPSEPAFQTTLPNLFIISDTTTPGSIASLSHAALALANTITL